MRRFRKLSICFFLNVCVLVLPSLANTLDWGNGYDVYPADIVDRFGALVGQSSGWAINMYRSTDAAIDFANGLPGSDESLVLSTTFDGASGVDGYFYFTLPNAEQAPYNLADGNNVYTVVFDNANAASANYFVVLDDAMWTFAWDGTSSEWVDPQGCVAGDWQAVPEPSTLALVGIGSAVLLARKRRRSRK